MGPLRVRRVAGAHGGVRRHVHAGSDARRARLELRLLVLWADGPTKLCAEVPGVEHITMVAAGDHYSLAVARDGRLWSWGEDRLCPQENDEPADVLGNQTPHVPLVLEVSVIGGSRVLFATAGASHAAVVTAAGELWAWGHYGIWRELMFSIRKSSTELNNASEPRWHFPSALSPEAHAEWGLYKILE